MSVIYLWRIHCIDENEDKVTWAVPKPTTCPNCSSSNITHEVIVNSKPIESLESSAITVSDTSKGYYQVGSIKMEVPSGTAGDITNIDITFPMETIIWTSSTHASANMVGDSICVVIDPDKSIGSLTDDLLIGQTKLYVNSTVLDTVKVGFDITVDNGTSKEDLGRVLDINTTESTIMVESGPTVNFYQTNTTILLNLCMIRDFVFDQFSNKIQFGDKGLRGKIVPADTIVRVKYKNNGTDAKTWYWKIEYFYGY
jgi:hypothetical protein